MNATTTTIDRTSEIRRNAIPERTAPKTKRQPRYHVVLWDDDDHSYDYVIRMMQELFGYARPMGQQIATTVDGAGRAVCLTTTMEHAELKRDQIRAYGKDGLVATSCGSMYATIEPVPES